jgi:hypothetical protein
VTEGLVLPVPQVLSAIYLVPTTLSAKDAEVRAKAALSDRVASPVGTTARKMLEVGAVKVGSQPPSAMPPLPAWLQQHLGVAPEARCGRWRRRHSTPAAPPPSRSRGWCTGAASCRSGRRSGPAAARRRRKPGSVPAPGTLPGPPGCPGRGRRDGTRCSGRAGTACSACSPRRRSSRARTGRRRRCDRSDRFMQRPPGVSSMRR